LTLKRTSKLFELVNMFKEDQKYQFKKFNLVGGSANLYFSTPEQLRKMTEENLEKTIGELEKEDIISEKRDLVVNASVLASKSLKFKLKFE